MGEKFVIPKVEGAIDPKRLSIKHVEDLGGRAPCVHYDDVPLWRTVVGLDCLEIFLAPGEEDEPHTLMCRDQYDDIYTYGQWSTLEEAMAWLDKPVRLY